MCKIVPRRQGRKIMTARRLDRQSGFFAGQLGIRLQPVCSGLFSLIEVNLRLSLNARPAQRDEPRGNEQQNGKHGQNFQISRELADQQQDCHKQQ